VQRLLQAAGRGVRVRVLLDDIHTRGKDFNIALVDAHPNVEVRLFNPFANRSRRGLEFLTSMSRVNHRMHNKLFLMDNALAVVGGRNIGDHYFGVNTTTNFRDLDLLAVGPIVPRLSASFDEFWNSDWAMPVAAFLEEPPRKIQVDEAVARLCAWMEQQTGFPYPIENTQDEIVERLQQARGRFIWGPAEVLSDTPHKVGSDGSYQGIAPTLAANAGDLREELLIESAYFVPGKEGVEGLSALVARGVRVRVLTNSLASNDVVPAHAGYARNREGLLAGGVDLHELRPDAGSVRNGWSLHGSSSAASLHTKAVVFDREKVFIGTYNLDPRSRSINTEIALLVESPELAEQVVAFMDSGARPDNSYRVVLEEDAMDAAAALTWTAEDGGRKVRYDSDPEVGFWRRLSADFLSLLPMESQL